MANYSYSHDAYPTYASSQYGNTSPTRTHARPPAPRRASTQKEVKRIDEGDLVLGRVFWLPPKEELPPRAVRRAHGKGAVEEGIYNHPVVVISRPAEEPQLIYFHIVSSSSTFPSKTYIVLIHVRSRPSKANGCMKSTPKATNFTPPAAHGIFLFHPLPCIQMPPPRRCKSVFLPWS